MQQFTVSGGAILALGGHTLVSMWPALFCCTTCSVSSTTIPLRWCEELEEGLPSCVVCSSGALARHRGAKKQIMADLFEASMRGRRFWNISWLDVKETKYQIEMATRLESHPNSHNNVLKINEIVLAVIRDKIASIMRAGSLKCPNYYHNVAPLSVSTQ